MIQEPPALYRSTDWTGPYPPPEPSDRTSPLLRDWTRCVVKSNNYLHVDSKLDNTLNIWDTDYLLFFICVRLLFFSVMCSSQTDSYLGLVEAN